MNRDMRWDDREIAPRDGLTRENTGYPAAPYFGWFLTKKGLRHMEMLHAKRWAIKDIEPEKRLTVEEQRERMKREDWARSGRDATKITMRDRPI